MVQYLIRRTFLSASQIFQQLSGDFGMFELFQSRRFDLTDPFTGNMQNLSDLFESEVYVGDTQMRQGLQDALRVTIAGEQFF